MVASSESKFESHSSVVQLAESSKAAMTSSYPPPAWHEAVAGLVLQGPSSSVNGGCARRLSCLVLGAKNVGKSSFARVLLNRLLSLHPRVAYLDCDPGQPEFTPPGLLSLHLVDKPVDGMIVHLS